MLATGTPANFAELLLSRAAPEDLLTYTARDLAQLAQDAWEFLAERRPGNVKIRLQSPLGGDRLGDISVIETPPEGRRPVKTYVGEYDEALVKQALMRA